MNLLGKLSELNEVGLDISILGDLGGGSTLALIGVGIFIVCVILSIVLDNNSLYRANDTYNDIKDIENNKDAYLKSIHKNINLNSSANKIDENLKEFDNDILYYNNYLKKHNKSAYFLLKVKKHFKFLPLDFLDKNKDILISLVLIIGATFFISGCVIGGLNETKMISVYEDNLDILNKSEESIDKFEILSIIPSLNESGSITYLINIKKEGNFESLKYNGTIKSSESESDTNTVYVLNEARYNESKNKLDVDSLLDFTLIKNNFVVDIEVTDEIFKNLNSVSTLIK